MHRLFSYVLFTLFFTSIAQAQPGLSQYTLGSGDQVRIHVYGEEDLTFEVLLTDAGTISYPFLGEMNVLGMTVGQLQDRIVRGLLGDYLIDPKVSVTILEYRQFYIDGEVERPGGYPFKPGLTVRKAVSLAEGFTERASKSNILILSDSDETRTPRKIKLHEPIKPGDIITVERSFF